MNTPFQITAPGLYKTRDGRKAEVKFGCKYHGHPVWVGIIDEECYSWFHDGSAQLADTTLIAPWTEPRRRPFTQAEVMKLGFVWVRQIGNPGIESPNISIVGTTKHEIVALKHGCGLRGITYVTLMDTSEYTLDGGDTWLPFWKEEA